MCSDDRKCSVKCSRGKSSRADSLYAPRPARVPLSTERPSRIAVPAHVRVPLSIEKSHRATAPAPVRVPLSIEESHRATAPAPVRVPLSIERSSRATVPAPVRVPLSIEESHRATVPAPVRVPLSIERSSRATVPAPVRVPLSIEESHRVTVPVQARHPSPRRATQTQNIPLSVLTPQASDQGPVNTYKQPNPWTPGMNLERDEYKAANRLSGAASSRYKRERRLREKEVDRLPKHTYTPMGLTPENHFELLPMAVDWEGKAVNHHRLRKGFNDAYPRAYESPAAKLNHEDEIVHAASGIEKARGRVAEHEIHQGFFTPCDPYDNLHWVGHEEGNSAPPDRRRNFYNYDAYN
ncbi:hypothetical protein BDR22DRAFT_676639 [Usnea florida]